MNQTARLIPIKGDSLLNAFGTRGVQRTGVRRIQNGNKYPPYKTETWGETTVRVSVLQASDLMLYDAEMLWALS